MPTADAMLITISNLVGCALIAYSILKVVGCLKTGDSTSKTDPEQVTSIMRENKHLIQENNLLAREVRTLHDQQADPN